MVSDKADAYEQVMVHVSEYQMRWSSGSNTISNPPCLIMAVIIASTVLSMLGWEAEDQRICGG